MIASVDLRRLQVLRMVHQYGTVTAAARALHLTPSAVSHQIRQLSRETGLALLEPDGRRVRLTPAGDGSSAATAKPRVKVSYRRGDQTLSHTPTITDTTASRVCGH